MRASATTIPAAALVAVALIGNVGGVLAAAYGLSLRPVFSYLYLLGVAWAIAWWMESDCRERRLPIGIDH